MTPVFTCQKSSIISLSINSSLSKDWVLDTLLLSVGQLRGISSMLGLSNTPLPQTNQSQPQWSMETPTRVAREWKFNGCTCPWEGILHNARSDSRSLGRVTSICHGRVFCEQFLFMGMEWFPELVQWRAILKRWCQCFSGVLRIGCSF